MTINNNLIDFINSVSNIVNLEGFSVNWKKLTISGPDVRHTVTGLSNNKRVSSTRTFYSLTRALANQLYVENGYKVNGKTYLGTDDDSLNKAIQVIEGRYAFINNIENKNANLYVEHHNGDEYHAITSSDFQNQRVNKDNHLLSGKQLSYSKFLFFKLFLSGDRITVFTEGMTDVIHIKTAMKLLNPHLKLTLKSFQTEIERGSTFSQLFDINRGGEGLVKVLNYYFSSSSESRSKQITKTNYQYWEYFKNKTLPIKPVVLLFDCEFDSKKSPINNVILKYINLIFNDKYKENIKQDYQRENQLVFLTKTVKQKKESVDKHINTFKNNFEYKIKTELKEKGFYKLKGNLYIAVTSDLKEYTHNRSIEDYFPNEFLTDIVGNQSCHFEKVNVDKTKSKPMGKYLFAKYVENKLPLRADKENVMKGFKALLTIFEMIQEDYIKELSVDVIDTPDGINKTKLIERLIASKNLKLLVQKYTIPIIDKQITKKSDI